MLEPNGRYSRAGQESSDCVDVREAVYLRMAPADPRAAPFTPGLANDELETGVLRRLFPSVREEATFWYQAGKGRGVVLWTQDSMRYVPEARIEDVLKAARPETRAAATRAAMTYSPLCEAVVVMVLDEFEAVAAVAPGDTTLHSVRKLIDYT